MKYVSISLEAEMDIDQIAAYTTKTWGSQQTGRYLDQLEDAFQFLAQNPSIGRPCPSIQTGLFRFEVRRHVVFYRTEPNGIRVVRVLHQRMMPIKARFEQ